MVPGFTKRMLVLTGRDCEATAKHFKEKTDSQARPLFTKLLEELNQWLEKHFSFFRLGVADGEEGTYHRWRSRGFRCWYAEHSSI